MSIKYIKYGIFALCFSPLIIVTSGCSRTEFEEDEVPDDSIVFEFSENKLPELKSGMTEASGKVSTLTLKSDADEIFLYRTERNSESVLDDIFPATKGAPVTTENLGRLYKDELYTSAYSEADHGLFFSPLKLAYEEYKEDKSIWRVTKSFVWPEKDGKLSFWAWAPNSIIGSAPSIDDGAGTMTFSYIMSESGTGSKKADAEAQKDIILGHTVTAKPDNYISMNMVHALTGLRFQMENTIEFKLKSITLGGVLTQGVCTFSPDPSKEHAYDQIMWSVDAEKKADYTQDFNQHINDGTEYAPQEIGLQEATFMVIPQCAKDGNEISFDMTIEIDGLDKEYSAMLVDQDWQPGVTYIYGISIDDVNFDFKLTDTEQETSTFTNSLTDDNTTIYVTSKVTRFEETTDQGWQIKSYIIDGVETAVGGESFEAGGLIVKKDGLNLSVVAKNRIPERLWFGEHKYWAGDHGDWSPESWGAKGVIDLSRFNYQMETVNAYEMTTANCYVIRHAGTYKFPLIYGNAVFCGHENVKSYKSGASLTPFLNHLSKGITNAVIEENAGSTTGSFISAASCCVLWQDEDEVIRNVQLTAPETVLIDNKEHSVRYLQFTVDDEKICQNNALLAIKDESGNVIWSWQIWTTNDPALLSSAIAVKNANGNIYNFLPLYSIGWVDPKDYPARKDVDIVLEQFTSGNTLTVKVLQPEVLGYGYGTLYQFGRKDPMCRYDEPAKGVFTLLNQQTTVQNSILNPNIMYYKDGTNWCNTNYYNLWTGKNNSSYSTNPQEQNDATMYKTVYDPSPVGYKAPASGAHTGFNATKATMGRQGWIFQINGSESETLYFPYGNWRAENSGGLMPIYWGCYWTIISDNGTKGQYFTLSDKATSTGASNSKSRACPVRPVTEPSVTVTGSVIVNPYVPDGNVDLYW